MILDKEPEPPLPLGPLQMILRLPWLWGPLQMILDKHKGPSIALGPSTNDLR